MYFRTIEKEEEVQKAAEEKAKLEAARRNQILGEAATNDI